MLPRTKIIIAAVILFLGLIVIDQWSRSSSSDSDNTGEASSQTSSQTNAESMEWKEFRPADNTFSVMLPALPQHASDSVPLPSGQGYIKYDMYLSQEKDGTTFMISLIQYPDSFNTTNSAELLEDVMKEMMKGNANNKLRGMDKGQFRQFPALDFAIENRDVFIHSKAFLATKMLVVLTVIGRDKNAVDTQFSKFATSFTLGGSPTLAPSETALPPSPQPQ